MFWWNWFKTDPSKETPEASVSTGDVISQACLMFMPNSQPAKRLIVSICKDGSAIIEFHHSTHTGCTDEFTVTTRMALSNAQRVELACALTQETAPVQASREASLSRRMV